MPNWTLAADDLEAEVTLSDAGELSLALRHGGRDVIAPSRLGLRAAHEDLSQGLTFEAITTGEIDDSYATVTGKRREHRYVAKEWTLSFTKRGHRLDLQVRISEQGVAYRYSVPWTGPVTVCEEVSEYVFPSSARAVLLPYDNGRCDYEEIHHHTAVADAEEMLYGCPALFEVGDVWVLVTESNLDATYAGSRLRFDGAAFRVDLPDSYVTTASPLVTPWRTMITGDLATIVESDLVTSLAEPSEVEDTSWINPGAAAWSWWSDGASASDAEAQRRWVDFAAAQGWPYLLVDAGWRADWIPELISYASERGVGIWLWSHWQHVDSEIEHREKLALWKEWGAVGVKIDFTESDGQDRMRWFDSILAATARLKLMVVFHGGTIPRGTERTWPHFMTAEAVKGAEWIKPKPGREPLYPPTHYLSLVFTRNVQGPMDFTPCTFTAVREISAGFELALAVLFESGVQHFADSIEAYDSRPEVRRLLAEVPTAWDDTKLLSGEPTSHVVLARRRGDEWYVGAGFSGNARVATVSLDFLGDGTWTADVYRDGPVDRIIAETITVDVGGKVDVPVAANGGFTLRLRRGDSEATA